MNLLASLACRTWFFYFSGSKASDPVSPRHQFCSVKGPAKSQQSLFFTAQRLAQKYNLKKGLYSQRIHKSQRTGYDHFQAKRVKDLFWLKHTQKQTCSLLLFNINNWIQSETTLQNLRTNVALLPRILKFIVSFRILSFTNNLLKKYLVNETLATKKTTHINQRDRSSSREQQVYQTLLPSEHPTSEPLPGKILSTQISQTYTDKELFRIRDFGSALNKIQNRGVYTSHIQIHPWTYFLV